MIYSTTSRLPAKSKGPLSKRTRCRHFPYSELKLLHTSTEATDKSKRYRPRNQFMMARQHLTSTFKDGRCARVKSIRASQIWHTGNNIFRLYYCYLAGLAAAYYETLSAQNSTALFQCNTARLHHVNSAFKVVKFRVQLKQRVPRKEKSFFGLQVEDVVPS